MNKKLLINNTLNVKQAILNVNDWMLISRHYRRAQVQEYVYESAPFGLTVDDALKVADLAIEKMDKYGYCENDAVNMACADCGFPKIFEG